MEIIIIITIVVTGFIAMYMHFYFSDITIDDKPFKQYHFQNVRFSIQEFFSLLETAFEEQQIKGLYVCRYTQREGGIFSPKREYLQIQFKSLFVEINAFHFGSGISITCRRGIRTYIKKILDSSSFFNALIRDIFIPQTAYRIDSEQSFRNNLDSVVRNSINRMTSLNGVRQ